MTHQESLYGKTPDQLAALCGELGMPRFAARQIARWLYVRHTEDPLRMTDIAAAHRQRLAERFSPALSAPERVTESADGTKKYLFRTLEGHYVESAYIPDGERATLCVSSQAGCRMGCRFCASTIAGFVRHLLPSEMLLQVYETERDSGRHVDSIVLMGIGEPLDNFDEVMRFLENITSPEGVNIGMRNISLSTCGLVPKIDQLAEKKLQLTLSISLHAPTNQIRSSMMPVNDAYPVEQLIQTVRRYQETTGRRVSFEYSMVRGVNDSDVCAKQLADLIRGMGAHVNLIPINPVDGSPYSATDAANVRRFQQKLESLGVNATVRRRLGSEISAACGQLRRDEMNGKA